MCRNALQSLFKSQLFQTCPHRFLLTVGTAAFPASHWIEELERTQNLASWQPSTLLAVAMGKLRGAAADWKAVIGRQCPTWETFRQAFQDQFSAKQTLLQWQQAVTCRVQAHEENLVNYSLAKLKLISGCPVHSLGHSAHRVRPSRHCRLEPGHYYSSTTPSDRPQHIWTLSLSLIKH
ncbi:hypothetical protein HPB48_002413 [Haemaphysalis longicornis]|uniref:Retrotransposon gag domain-containing protein n=1 Tax=Haemaphysalis longicornis TaxID=44386 RepID=A0A9J6FMK4_HAELO|nr:hypothetical protein HPB48_002413 [Haemaphysalis longicornis]